MPDLLPLPRYPTEVSRESRIFNAQKRLVKDIACVEYQSSLLKLVCVGQALMRQIEIV